MYFISATMLFSFIAIPVIFLAIGGAMVRDLVKEFRGK